MFFRDMGKSEPNGEEPMLSTFDLVVRCLTFVDPSLEEGEHTLETRLFEDCKFDSLDAVEFIMELESCFGIEISDADMDGLKTLGDIVSYIERHR